MSRFDTDCVHTALRLLNIALSMDAISIILQSAPETTLALNEDRPVPANTALCVLCDYNKLLLLDTFKDSAAMAWLNDNDGVCVVCGYDPCKNFVTNVIIVTRGVWILQGSIL